MQKLFTKILLPVIFNKDTAWSVEKAVQLANKYECDIILLHVQVPPATSYLFNIFFPGPASKPVTHSQPGMEALRQPVRYKLKDGLQVTLLNYPGYWQAVLKDVIISEHIDLVVIPKSRRNRSNTLMRRIDINKLSQQTNCPVLTVTRSFNANHLHNIVVPVNNHLPVKKLSIATYLSLHTSGQIFLMGNENQSLLKKGDGFLMRSYQLLNEFGKPRVQCAFSDQYDPVSGTLAYARNVHADLIVVNTGQESKLRGWWNKLMGKYLFLESDIPVLTVAL